MARLSALTDAQKKAGRRIQAGKKVRDPEQTMGPLLPTFAKHDYRYFGEQGVWLPPGHPMRKRLKKQAARGIRPADESLA